MIRDQPYLLTPGSHNSYWFRLDKPADGAAETQPLPELIFPDSHWDDLFDTGKDPRLGTTLARYVANCLRSHHSAGELRSVRMAEHFTLPSGACLAVMEASHAQVRTYTYLLPLMFVTPEKAADTDRTPPQALIAALDLAGEMGFLIDATHDPAFHADLLALFVSRKKIRWASVSVLNFTP